MSSHNNPFVWYELISGNTDLAVKFYRSVFGWEARDSGMTHLQYTLLSAGGRDIAGIYQMPTDGSGEGMRPGWLGYIAGDVEQDTARVVAAGGAVHCEPMDIPGVGRFAIVADPGGAMFVIFSPLAADTMPPAATETVGHFSWHELHAADGGKAFAFYEKMFGWTEAESLDMGPNGLYRIFAINGVPSGGMMTKMPETPAPFWQFYANVDGIDAAAERVRQGGGTILMGPHEVPGGSWIVNALDPEGVIFAMVSTTR